MPSREVAERLISAKTKREREKILSPLARAADLELARELKNICYEVWTTEPVKAQKTALALESLVKINFREEIGALFYWVAGIADLTRGKLEKAIENLDRSAGLFFQIGQKHEAAQTKVAKLIALALLGKYDEAVATGRSALKIFEKYGDHLAAGKIEMNLSNTLSRRGFYRESEKLALSALRRFEKSGEKTWRTMARNALANTYTELNDFRQAEKFYAEALKNARDEQMFVTEAEIEASMGNLALFRGRFDEALRLLELSRQKYEELKMPHQRAVAELEIADIYLELNLADEAYAIYERVAESLRKLKLQGEEARARANFGKAALIKNETKKAKSELGKSARLYVLEKNPNGAAGVKLTEAGLELARQNYENAQEILTEAEALLRKSEDPRQKLLARWLRGEIYRNLGKYGRAEKLLRETLAAAVANEQSNLAQICLNSLGNLELNRKNPAPAEAYFKRAVRMIETLRAPLAAEEFRMAFLAGKLAPFENLAKIYVAEKDFEKAFLFTEKARARTLLENLDGRRSAASSSKSAGKLAGKLADLREELNWLYSRLNRAETSEYENLQREAKKREKQISGLMRQIESARAGGGAEVSVINRNIAAEPDLELLQKELGKNRALIEFVNFDGSLAAFVVTEEKIEFVPQVAAENEILVLLEGLRFQFGALRYGKQNVAAFLPELKNRADFYLRKLYEKLIRPLAALSGERDLVIVPVGAAHYVPFRGLFDGESYLVETREIVSAPSAAVWRLLSKKPARKIKNALLAGFADASIPLVGREIEILKEILPAAKILTGDEATVSNYTQNAPDKDVLHLACHGQFRPDNPLFSSLHLADGFITVRDICAQRLKARLVTLSACETGLNKIFAGDEILGLARGFLAAGAESLVLSLWTVSDEATAELMQNFYENLQRGASVSASLSQAQRNFIRNNAHPYFWSPFTVIGK